MWTNHWGRWVDTGVISLGSLEHIDDLVTMGDVIDLTYEEGFREFKREKITALAYDPEVQPKSMTRVRIADQFADRCIIYGVDFIVTTSDDLSEEKPFAAIVRYDSMVAQVIKSYWVRRGALCSPCYPGQVHLDTPGDYLGYDFPQWVYGDRGQNPTSQEEYKPAPIAE